MNPARSYLGHKSQITRLLAQVVRAVPPIGVRGANVRFGSKADILVDSQNVRSYPAASTGRRNTLAQTEESEFVLTSQRHSPWFTLHEKPGPWNHCQPSSNGNVKRLL